MILSVDVHRVQSMLAAGTLELEITNHARIEALKDGLLPTDLQAVALSGDIVEDYPENDRALLLGFFPENSLPCHVVLEYVSAEPFAMIVTAYVPDDRVWHRDYK